MFAVCRYSRVLVCAYVWEGDACVRACTCISVPLRVCTCACGLVCMRVSGGACVRACVDVRLLCMLQFFPPITGE